MYPYRLSVLVCPLNWGLGHATRCIPLIKKLIAKDTEVIIAASGRALYLLRREFPNLECIDLPGFSPSYPSSGAMAWKMLLSLPSFLYHLINEKQLLSRIIKLNNFDVIISDHRYGIFDKKTYSILIIHQIRIMTPRWMKWAEPLIAGINRLLISRFNEIWIPDYPSENNLSGDLAHTKPLPSNSVFIGPLSRLPVNRKVPIDNVFRIVVIVSGQEPQRSIFEEIILLQLRKCTYPVTLFGGKPESAQAASKDGNIVYVPFAVSYDLAKHMIQSSLIICRSGYSTIMDLARIGKKALLVPTPGQTEQEYLGSLMMSKGLALCVEQNKLDLDIHIQQALQYRGFVNFPEQDLLGEQIDRLEKLND